MTCGECCQTLVSIWFMTGYPEAGTETRQYGCIYLEEDGDDYKCLIMTEEIPWEDLSENVQQYYVNQCRDYPNPEDAGQCPPRHTLCGMCTCTIEWVVSEDLYAKFRVRQGSAELLSKLNVGQDSAELLGKFEVGQDSAELLGKAVIRQSGSAELLGRFEAQATAELLGKLNVGKDSAELLGKFEVGQDSAELLGGFNVGL